jgi:hypothetical protein
MLNAAELKVIASQARVNGDIVEDRFDELYEYYTHPDRGTDMMPYGTAKARTGDPYNWIADQLDKVPV